MIRVAIIMGKMHAGGKKNLVMEYYRHIDRNKIQFDFLCDADSNSVPKDEIEALGGRVYIIPPYQNILANMSEMKRIFIENKYLVVHGYNSTMNLFAMLVGKQCGIPIRINESISMGHKKDSKNLFKSILRPFSSCFATHYMSNGEECGRWQFGNKLFDAGMVTVFKTVIDTEKHKYEPELREKCRKEYGLEDNVVIGHIGRFTAQKNTLFIIDIFNEIAKREQRAKLLLIGHGELERQMMDRVKRYGLEDKVLNLGKREDIHQFYNAMDCFLLPSLYEGLPIVGVEAECCGLPMFFSTEIPKESSPCDDLGIFISLDRSAKDWAIVVLDKIRILLEKRKDHSFQVSRAGFDSISEGSRLSEYYIDIVSSLADVRERGGVLHEKTLVTYNQSNVITLNMCYASFNFIERMEA